MSRSDAQNLTRPQTSGGAFMRKNNDFDDRFRSLNETAEDDLDKELNELIIRN